MCSTHFSVEGGEVNRHLTENRRQIPRAELLKAPKASLRELESAKLISPADLGIIDQKRILRQQRAALENDDSDRYEVAG
jgi:hypothetical protein